MFARVLLKDRATPNWSRQIYPALAEGETITYKKVAFCEQFKKVHESEYLAIGLYLEIEYADF